MRRHVLGPPNEVRGTTAEKSLGHSPAPTQDLHPTIAMRKRSTVAGTVRKPFAAKHDETLRRQSTTPNRAQRRLVVVLRESSRPRSNWEMECDEVCCAQGVDEPTGGVLGQLRKIFGKFWLERALSQ